MPEATFSQPHDTIVSREQVEQDPALRPLYTSVDMIKNNQFVS